MLTSFGAIFISLYIFFLTLGAALQLQDPAQAAAAAAAASSPCPRELEWRMAKFFKEKNGQQVKNWHTDHDWPMQVMVNSKSCSGSLGGITSSSSNVSTHSVVKWFQPQEKDPHHPHLNCCRDNASDWSKLPNLQKWDMGSGFFSANDSQRTTDFYYEYVIPESCQPDAKSSKGPCPLLVSLGMVHFLGEAQYCSGCVDDLGVVQLLLYSDEQWHMEHNWINDPWLKDNYIRKLTQDFISNYSQHVDQQRIYIAGTSEGGSGALMVGFTEPDLFSRVFATGPLSFYGQNLWLSPTNRVTETSGRSLHEYTHLFHERSEPSRIRLQNINIFMGGQEGIDDDKWTGVVDWAKLPEAIERVGVTRSPNVSIEYRVYPEYPHCSWGPTFNDFYDIVWRGV